MTFEELIKKANQYYPAILLDFYGTHTSRKFMRKLIFFVLAGLFVLVFTQPFISDLSFIKDGFINWLEGNIFVLRALFFLFSVVWFSLYLLEAMYMSFYFSESDIDFEVAKLVYQTEKDDITKSFLDSDIGALAMVRLGITGPSISQFLNKRTDYVIYTEYTVILDDPKLKDDITLEVYAKSLLHYDEEFKKFLSDKGITPEAFKGVLRWVSRSKKKIKQRERWWSKERLNRIPSIGANWAFGQIYLVKKYGWPIEEDKTYLELGDKWKIFSDVVNKLEQVLVKSNDANIMLVSETNSEGLEVVASLGREIIAGTVLPELEVKRMFILDTGVLIDSQKVKTNFELEFRKILAQAAGSGNVVLVIPNMPGFIESSRDLGSDAIDILSQFLNSTQIQIIGIADKKGYHSTLETDKDLVNSFEKFSVEDLDTDSLINLIENEAEFLEAKYDVTFTYQSILAVIEGAKRYFSNTGTEDKALDLVNEIAPIFSEHKEELIRESDVLKLIETRTGIPQGEVRIEEKKKLESLEDILHKRVVGQKRAITAVSQTLKRARSGLSNPKRPIGSFLFLGPTGVGKTETTKALAETYFGYEENIIRLDMSEYNTSEGIDKLIGSFHTNKPGVLASSLLDKQYGVLLLDEFEKAHSEVRDLFLQILDEGGFSDSRGEKINARNTIIIATSNAGSDLIYEKTKDGEDVAEEQEEIVDEIVKRGIFKPELINRFDSVVVFHALTEEHLKKIAVLMLGRLNDRLLNKGITISVSKVLTDYLVKVGSDQKFGARAMNRAVQDEIESVIADAIVAGKIKRGNTISLIPSGGKLEVKVS